MQVGKGRAQAVVENANNQQRLIDQAIERGKDFDWSNWKSIAESKCMFFAQTYPSASFASELITLPIEWVTQMVAGLAQLETWKKVPR